MAQHNSHLSFSTAIGLGYTFVGFWFFDVFPETLLLTFVMVLLCGLLPDIDAPGGSTARDMSALLAIVPPLLLIENFPALKQSGISRLVLVTVISYAISRHAILKLVLEKRTSRRGITHSIPGAIICAELVYLLLWDLSSADKIFVGGGALISYLSHLALDSLSEVDANGKPSAPLKPNGVFKLGGLTLGSTLAAYALMTVLTFSISAEYVPKFQSWQTSIEQRSVAIFSAVLGKNKG